ncbi:MAG: ATP-binding protein [Theionarchaea archaeon]|nr:ATP-binding protein [Theionarchaea archaeon]
MAGLIAIKNELKPLQDRFKKKIAQLQIPDERILNYWSEDYISEFGQENFEEFKKWVEEKGISREKLIEFFVTSGYPIENAEVEAEKLILNLSRTLAKKVDKSDIRELFKVIIDVIAENKEDLSVDIEDILIGIDKVLDSQDRLLNLYGERFILLPPSLFKSRDDVKDILKFKFVGREEELKRLHDFMKGDSKIMAVFGEGGSGKTRLLVEFADQVENKVYFVHPQKSFEHVRIEDAVLVLDDASKYKDFEKVVDFAVNPESWGSRNVKLIILNRNFFRKETVDRLKAKSIYCDVFDLGGADIAEFVKVNYGIGKVDEIISESGDNFFFASVIAEYFKESGEIDLLKALEHRIEKYIEDLRKEPGKLSEEELAIYILSLIMPVDLKKDSEALKRIVDYDRFCVALESDLVKRVDDDYVIRPDPVGDYIRLKFMEEYRHLFDRYMNDFLVYMPFRIAYNVVTMPRLRKDAEGTSLELLEGIWEDLNTKDFESLEYFDALIFFTGDLRGIVAKHIERAETAKWIMIAEKMDGNKTREKLAKALVNAIYYYGEVKDSDKVETLLTELRRLHEEYKEKETREELAKALYNATYYYGEVKDSDKVETLLTELRRLHEEYKERETREKLAKALYNATNDHGEVKDFDKVETLLTELRRLHEEYKERETREELASALVNATICLSYTKYEYLHIILEAYTNRYYLPEKLQRTHQKYLETLTINLVSNRMIELHAKGEEYLTQFMKTIQTYLTDETEFTLLMNEVTEKLPENIQKAVWKIIDRLNE